MADRGITLVEILVAVAMVGIVVAISIPLICLILAPTSGVVIDKQIVEGHYEERDYGHFINTGDTQIYIPDHRTVWVDTAYWLKLDNGKKQGWRAVGQGAYELYKIGDFYGVEK